MDAKRKLLIIGTCNELLMDKLQNTYDITYLPNVLLLTIQFPYKGLLFYYGNVYNTYEFDVILLLSHNRIAQYVYDILSVDHIIIGNPYTRSILKDKVKTAILLDRAGVQTTPSLYSYQNPYIIHTAKGFGDNVVEKPVDGSLGKGVKLLNTDGLQPKRDKIYQKYIDCGRSDERLIIVDGKLVAAMKRSSTSENEFRSSIALGGVGEALPLTDDRKELCKNVWNAFPDGCVYMGIDVLHEISSGEVYVGECNSFPLHNIISVTGHDFYIDVCEYIIKEIDKQISLKMK